MPRRTWSHTVLVKPTLWAAAALVAIVTAVARPGQGGPDGEQPGAALALADGQTDVQAKGQHGPAAVPALDGAITPWQDLSPGSLAPGSSAPESLAKMGARKRLKPTGNWRKGAAKIAGRSNPAGSTASQTPAGRAGLPGRKKPGAQPSGGPGLRPGDEEPPFQFKSLIDVPFLATIETPLGQPLPMARVSVMSALAPPPPGQALEDVTSPEAYFDGFSGSLGQIDATLSLPATLDEVDVVVLLSDHKGAYTHEELRALWGPFAPSSRTTVAVGDLATLTLVLAHN